MKVSFPHTDLLIEHLAQGTKVSSILFDQSHGSNQHKIKTMSIKIKAQSN